MKKNDTHTRFIRYRSAIDREIEKLKPFSASPILGKAMEQALFPGGKRMRPILSLAAGEPYAMDWDALLPVAASVELLHTASLILDDLPAMDNAELRQGAPALHLAFSPGTTILCGHGLVALALHIPTRTNLPDSACRNICRELALCIGPHGMAAGQAEDLLGISKNHHDALQVAAYKTGYLFGAAAYCGAIAGGADDTSAKRLREFGRHLGTAFQIADDFHDMEKEDRQNCCVNTVAVLDEEMAGKAFELHLDKAGQAIAGLARNRELLCIMDWVREYV